MESSITRKNNLKRKIPHEIGENKTEEGTTRKSNYEQILHSDNGARIRTEADCSKKKRKLENDSSGQQQEIRSKHYQSIPGENCDILNQPGQTTGKGSSDVEKTKTLEIKILNATFTVKAVAQEELDTAEKQLKTQSFRNNVLKIDRNLYQNLTVPQGILIEKAIKEGRVKADNEKDILEFQRRLCLLFGNAESHDRVATHMENTIQIRVKSEDGLTVHIKIEKWRSIFFLLQKAKDAMEISSRANLQVNERFLTGNKLICEEGLIDNQVVLINKLVEIQ